MARRLCLLWGAHSVHSADVKTYEETVEQAEAYARNAKVWLDPPEFIVVVAGVPFGTAGTTNNLRVVQMRPVEKPLE